MPTTVVPAAPPDEPVLRNLAQLYAYDFAEISRLTGDDGVRDMAEFFVARTARGRGVGARAARSLFERFGGHWEVRQTASNSAALAFWRNVIGRYTGGHFEESIHDGPRWRGPVQTFVCPSSAPA